MAVLHLLSNPQAVESCLAAVAPGDAVLLLGDGLFAHRRRWSPNIRVGALGNDATSRGVDLLRAVEVLSYGDFVEWVTTHSHTVTWR